MYKRQEQYRWPKEKPIANGKHVYTHNDLNLLIIDTDEGISGYGCSWAIEFAESMGKAIIGEDPLNNERLWQKIYVPKFIGRRGTSCKTVSAIDIALWDKMCIRDRMRAARRRSRRARAVKRRALEAEARRKMCIRDSVLEN